MSYIEKHLLPGESVLYRTKLHWSVYILPMLFVLVILAPMGYIAARSDTTWLVVIPVALALGVLLVPFLKRTSSEFAVTNKRVIIKLGVLSTRSVELLLTKVEGIVVTQSLGGRMFNYGEIVVSGSGGTQEPFSGIQGPLHFRQAVQAATESSEQRTVSREQGAETV